jgi:hypothetical protein
MFVIRNIYRRNYESACLAARTFNFRKLYICKHRGKCAEHKTSAAECHESNSVS